MSKTLLFDEVSRSDPETEALGASLAARLVPGDFVAMYGDLGAGKTAFVRGMATVLAPDAAVCSPTYTIVNEYPSPLPGKIFRHLDLYRITGEDDLASIGFFDFCDDSSGYIAAEWCEKIPFALPESHYRVTLSKINESTRRIVIERVEQE